MELINREALAGALAELAEMGTAWVSNFRLANAVRQIAQQVGQQPFKMGRELLDTELYFIEPASAQGHEKLRSVVATAGFIVMAERARMGA